MQDDPHVHNEVSAKSIANIIQANAIHGDVYLGSPTHETPPTIAPPRDWAELPELPDAIFSLMHAQVEAAHDLPYRLPGARRPSLATVHVRQDLGSPMDDEVKEVRSAPVLDSRGQVVQTGPPLVRLAVRPPSRTITQALDDDDHLVVTGGPGQGKSTLSLRLAADIGNRWLGASTFDPLTEPVVPLRITARVLGRHLRFPFPQALVKAAQEEHGAMLGPDLAERHLRCNVAGCRWLLLVDGLDEVADAGDRTRLVRVLATWAFRPNSPYRVLLTTRPIEGAALAPMLRAGSNRYELQPFDDDALQRFAANWFAGGEDAGRFIAQLRTSHLTELVRVPLLATIAAVVYQQHEDRPLPDNQYELYEAYLRYLRRSPTTDCQPLMEHLGRVRVEEDTSLVAAVGRWIDDHPGERSPDQLVEHLAAVGPFTRRGDDLHFLHHSFAEHLAATAAARLLPPRFEPQHTEFARLLHSARPEQGGRYARAVLLHYARLNPTQAEAMVSWLHAGADQQHLLASRLLAVHLPAGDSVIETFLSTVRLWAMATGRTNLTILAQASRATHFPGMADWLHGLMRDPCAPGESRVEAAVALATRLRGSHRGEALVVLREAVEDRDLVVAARVAAAEALSECGSAEREVAERGLKAVIADHAIDAHDLRRAAVVLASLGGSARQAAADALTALLDNPWATDQALGEAATALVEIGVEHHLRCVEVFRMLLARGPESRPIWTAGLGLASLGSELADEAAATLAHIAGDRCRSLTERTNAAVTLAELGPQHLASARRRLTAMSDMYLSAYDLWQLADALVEVGLVELAAEHYRTVLARPDSAPNARLWAARGLGRLGPDFEEETVSALRAVLAHPGAGRFDRASALGCLARVGPQHVAEAVQALRGLMFDLSGDPMLSCNAASELIQLGPEHHAAVIDGLDRIVSAHLPDAERIQAWQLLRSLHASEGHASPWFSGSDENKVAIAESVDIAELRRMDPGERAVLVATCSAVLADATDTFTARWKAAKALVDLGWPHHGDAVRHIARMIRGGEVADVRIIMVGNRLYGVSRAGKAEVVAAFLSLLEAPTAVGRTLVRVGRACRRLGHAAEPALIDALRCAMMDTRMDPDDRADVAVRLAESLSEALPDAVATVSHLAPVIADWRLADAVESLNQLGAELPHPDCPSNLRARFEDRCAPFLERSRAGRSLAVHEPEVRMDVVALNRAVLWDRREPVKNRVGALRILVEFGDRPDEVLSAFRYLATSGEFTSAELASAVSEMTQASYSSLPEVFRYGLALLRDPGATTRTLRQMSINWREDHQREWTRTLLSDRAAHIEWRMPSWLDRIGHAEAEAALRDACFDPVCSTGERIDAAALIGSHSHRHAAEMIEVLATYLGGPWHRRTMGALAELAHSWRCRKFDEEHAVMRCPDSAPRSRWAAALRIAEMTGVPSAEVADVLRATPTPRGLHALRAIDGWVPLRNLRDDPEAMPWTKTAAAGLLLETPEDRAENVRVLDGIARSGRPAVRCRAARKLMALGETGREQGALRLMEIVEDERFSVGPRATAAAVLAEERPDLRGRMVRLMQKLTDVDDMHLRVHVLLQRSTFESAEVARRLKDIAADRGIPARSRLRAATAMAAVRRDYWESAAIVAREVAHDEAVPVHIRLKAARVLAQRSELCRAEGRDLFVRLSALLPRR